MKVGKFPEDKIKVPDKQMRSVWSIPTPISAEKNLVSINTKAHCFIKRIVLASTKDNDIVLDPFNGGGTTGIACKLIGNRKYIGIDINSEYLELSMKRYKKYINQPNLFE